MNTIRLTVCALATLLLVSLTALRAADAAKPAAAETDTRLHADGKGWRLDKAKVTDPKRPRVLLIGDSILNGYLKSTTAALDGKAYVDAWVKHRILDSSTRCWNAEVVDGCRATDLHRVRRQRELAERLAHFR